MAVIRNKYKVKLAQDITVSEDLFLAPEPEALSKGWLISDNGLSFDIMVSENDRWAIMTSCVYNHAARKITRGITLASSDANNLPIAFTKNAIVENVLTAERMATYEPSTPDGVLNIKDYGAVGDGIVDDSAAIQGALNAANSKGGGTVYIPTGVFRKSDLSPMLLMYSNTMIMGDGDSSVIFHDDRDTNPRKDMLAANNATNVIFRDFRISGTALTYLNETNASQTLTGDNIDSITINNVTIEKVRFMATAFTKASRVIVQNSRLKYVVRDGWRFTDSNNVVIDGNNCYKVCDDVVALHCTDSSLVNPSAGFTVTNNTFEACQNVKVLGAKQLNITGNIFTRMIRGGIYIRTPGTGTEGNTNQYNINISDNVLTDTMRNGIESVIHVACEIGRATGGVGSQPGVNSIPYAYNNLNNLTSGTPVKVGMFNVNISNNIISRTLPVTASYSSYGYGLFFDRIIVGFQADKAITEADFSSKGIRVYAPVNGLRISGNTITGLPFLGTAIELRVVGSLNLIDFGNTIIESNNIIDCPGHGVSYTDVGSGVGARHVVVSHNNFDLDPYFRATNHNTDNTWTDTGTVIALVPSSNLAMISHGNTFKNMAFTGVGGNVVNAGGNIVYCDFVSQSNASNKGVRSMLPPKNNIIISIDGDPLSATFGSIQSTPLVTSPTIPTTGRYITGAFVEKETPAVLGVAASRYTVTGWWRLTGGTGHVLDTDWTEQRTLTGT